MVEAEIVVIGGGIAGASATYHLAAHGRDVALVERGEIASGASGVNAGAIDSVGWGHARDLQDHLTAGSAEIFEQVQNGLGVDVEFRRCGGIQGIRTEAEREFVRRRVGRLRAEGHVADLLTIREARTIEPRLSPALLGALYAPLRAQADPVKATRAFASLAEGRGARILTQREVTGIAPRSAGGYAIRTAGGDVLAGTLVIAAGAWSSQIGAMLDVEIPIAPVRGQMWATATGAPPRVFQTIGAVESAMTWDEDRGGAPPDLTHRSGVRVTRHLYGRQRANGEIVFGGDRELLGWDALTPDPTGVAVNHAHAAEILPFLEHLPITRTWAGLMPFSLDGKPLIGRLPGRDDVWIVGGLASSGFGRGPMAGKLLADSVHAGAPLPILAEADPARAIRQNPSPTALR